MNIEQIKVEELKPYPQNARIHSNEQIQQIKQSMIEFGFTNPILIDKDNEVIAGHGRLESAKQLKMQDVPCIRLEYLTEAQKKAYVLADNKLALNAEWDLELLNAEIQNLIELDYDIDITGFNDAELDDLLNEKENPYTAKIETPIYEPHEEKPKLTELYNDTKTQELIKKIKSVAIEPDLKDLLINASHRHTEFNFQKIAEYYAHADKEAQELIEENALVILDYEKAIEQGYVEMRDELAQLYIDEHGKNE